MSLLSVQAINRFLTAITKPEFEFAILCIPDNNLIDIKSEAVTFGYIPAKYQVALADEFGDFFDFPYIHSSLSTSLARNFEHPFPAWCFIEINQVINGKFNKTIT